MAQSDPQVENYHLLIDPKFLLTKSNFLFYKVISYSEFMISEIERFLFAEHLSSHRRKSLYSPENLFSGL